VHELGLGHPLKFIWEERAQSLTGYPNFWTQFNRKFPELRQATVTAREFAPGERVEVDYAGDPIEWVELRTGEIHKAWVFVAGLGFSQLLFAWVADDVKSRNRPESLGTIGRNDRSRSSGISGHVGPEYARGYLDSLIPRVALSTLRDAGRRLTRNGTPFSGWRA